MQCMQNLIFLFGNLGRKGSPSVPLKLSDNVGVYGKRAILFPY